MLEFHVTDTANTFLSRENKSLQGRDRNRSQARKICELIRIFLQCKNVLRYGGCLLYFGIREQKQILIIENRFIVFQNIRH